MKSKKSSSLGEHLLHNEKRNNRKSRVFKSSKEKGECDEIIPDMSTENGDRMINTTGLTSQFNNKLDLIELAKDLIHDGEKVEIISIPKLSFDIADRNESELKENSLDGANKETNHKYAIEAFTDKSKVDEFDDLDLKFDDIKLSSSTDYSDQENNSFVSPYANFMNTFHSFSNYDHSTNTRVTNTQLSNQAVVDITSSQYTGSLSSQRFYPTQFTSKSQLILSEERLLNCCKYFLNIIFSWLL